MAAEPDGLSQRRGRGPGKHATSPAEAPSAAAVASPCGACKFLRRKCISGCVFAPYFSSDQGAARFAAVHKVFGASNVSKLLLHIAANRRSDAVVTISYEAQARLSDPVYGCVSTILALQQQVASLQAELALVQNQLINSRIAVATAIHSTQQQQQQQHIHGVLQPAYSNNSSTCNNNHLLHMPSFNSNFDLATAADTSHSFLPIHQCRPPHDEEEEEEEEEETHNPLAFANHMLRQR